MLNESADLQRRADRGSVAEAAQKRNGNVWGERFGDLEAIQSPVSTANDLGVRNSKSPFDVGIDVEWR